MNIGWLGLQHILENGGFGVLSAPTYKRGRLHFVSDAPPFSHRAYVYSAEGEGDLIQAAIAGMHEIAAREVEEAERDV